jgi:hypothetical protein
VQSSHADVVNSLHIVAHDPAVTAASSATGKSLVPAHSTAMVPLRFARGLFSMVTHRAAS